MDCFGESCLVGGEWCFVGDEWCSGVRVIAVEDDGGAVEIGSVSWGRLGCSTTASVAAVEVMGRGAIGGGGEDLCGAGRVAESSAREPRTSVMTRKVVSVAGGGA